MDDEIVIKPNALERNDALTDTPIALAFERLDRPYPGSKFIYTVRNEDDWLASCSNFFGPDPFIKHRVSTLRHHLYGTRLFEKELFQQAFARQTERVEKFFAGREQDLLVIDICAGEGWTSLCPFLDKPFPAAWFPNRKYKVQYMKKIIPLVVIAVVLAYGFVQEQGFSVPGTAPWVQSADDAIQSAYDSRQSDLQIQGEGIVSRILRDDLDGSRHQKFLLKLDNGLTVLISHNIDLAPRINGLRKGDRVAFFGEYEWNVKGGVIHWTHHDPGGRHVGGWLKHAGQTYQ